MYTRKQKVRVVPAGAHRATIGVEVFASEQQRIVGYEQMPFDVNEQGQKAYYLEGERGNIYYDDGDAPDGYILRTKDDPSKPLFKTYKSQGFSFSPVEQSANGVDVTEIEDASMDVPRELGKTFIDAAQAILDHFAANIPE